MLNTNYSFATSDDVSFADFTHSKAMDANPKAKFNYTLASLELLYRSTINKIVVAILDFLNRKEGEFCPVNTMCHKLRGANNIIPIENYDNYYQTFDEYAQLGKDEQAGPTEDMVLNAHASDNTLICQYLDARIKHHKLEQKKSHLDNRITALENKREAKVTEYHENDLGVSWRPIEKIEVKLESLEGNQDTYSEKLRLQKGELTKLHIKIQLLRDEVKNLY